MKSINCSFFFGIFLVGFHLHAQPPQLNNNGVTNSTENVSIPSLDSVIIPLASEEELRKPEQAEYERQVQSLKQTKSEVRQNLNSRSATDFQQKAMDSQYSSISNLSPTNPNNGILYYELGNYDATREPWLAKAMLANPNHPEGLELSVANCIVIGDSLNLKRRLNTLDSLGLFSKDIQCYSIDLVNSVPTQSIMVTHGRWDTYGVLNEQLNKKDKNFLNVSLEMLQSPQYRSLLQKRGLNIPVQKEVDINYFKDFVNMNDGNQFAFSMTLPNGYLVQFEEDIIPYGLVFLYQNKLSDQTILSHNLLFSDAFSYLDCGYSEVSKYEELKDNYLPMIETIEALSDGKNSEQKSKLEIKKDKIKKRRKQKK